VLSLLLHICLSFLLILFKLKGSKNSTRHVRYFFYLFFQQISIHVATVMLYWVRLSIADRFNDKSHIWDFGLLVTFHIWSEKTWLYDVGRLAGQALDLQENPLNYGKFVAEAKFISSPIAYEAAIRVQVSSYLDVLCFHFVWIVSAFSQIMVSFLLLGKCWSCRTGLN
jgi:hypothetical protein